MNNRALLFRSLIFLSCLPGLCWHASPLTASDAGVASRATRVEELRQKQAGQKQKAAAIRKKVRVLKQKERAVTGQLQETQQKVERTTKELRTVNRQLLLTLRSLSDTRRKLIELKGELNQHLNELEDLLVAYYKNGRSAYAQVLMTSGSVGQFIRRGEMVRRIVQSDNELIETVEHEQRLVEEHERELETHKRRAEHLRGMISEKREEYRDAATEQKELLRKISKERAAYEQYLNELQQSSREIERMIRRLKAQRRRSGTAAKIVPWAGGLIRPVSGSVRSGFGYRTHPIFRIRKMHTGVDLAASYGTTIRAAAGGVVIFAGWKRGYGKTVVIDHGGELATLYAHCSDLLVSYGQNVDQGQAIARVGSTGYSTGPHLHFEVRRNGIPVNPLR